MAEVFKYCTKCGFLWETREAFLHDADIKLIGYQASFRELKAGLFLFNHRCGDTLALEVGSFADLYDGPIFQERMTNGAGCSEHCLHQFDLRPCPNHCECAFVREIMQIIQNYR